MTRPKNSHLFSNLSLILGAVSMRVLTKIIDIEKAKRKGEEINEDELDENKKKKCTYHTE